MTWPLQYSREMEALEAIHALHVPLGSRVLGREVGALARSHPSGAHHRSRTASARIPMGRYGDPQEFGRAATFLLSPAASYITGTSLQKDGGLVSAIP